MNEWAVLVVAGLAAGSIYALAAMGLVVTYTTSGVFNFAHGAIGIFVAFVFDDLRRGAGMPAAIALVLCVVVVAPALGALIDALFLRRLAGSASSTYVVVSLGLLVGLQGLTSRVFGSASRTMKPFLPTSTYSLAGVRVGWNQTIVVAVTAAAGIALYVFFTRTHLGLRTRAVVDDGTLTELVGVDAARVRTIAWMIGASFASLSAILLAPFIGLDVAILTLLVVRAFGAAVVGRLTSLPLTYAGGLAIGVAESLSSKLSASHPALLGLPPGVPFLVLFAVLVTSRKDRFVEVAKDLKSAARVPAAQPFNVRVAAVAVGGLLVAPFFLNSSRVLTATATVIFLLLFASLRLLVGLSRQVSLCHAVFVALGATTLAKLLDAGVPYLPALLLAGLVLVPIGAVVAIPAIRLSGLFLALATFGFGVLVQSLVYTTGLAFGADGVVAISRPSFAGISLSGDRGFYFFAVVIVVCGLALAEGATRSRLGRVLRAAADSPVAVQSLGVRVSTARVCAFCLSAFLAGVAGGLLGTLFSSVSASQYGYFDSLLWLAVLVAAGAASVAGSAVAAFLLVALPTIISGGAVTDFQPIAFGVLAVLLAQSPDGLVGLRRSPVWQRWADASAWRRGRSPARARRVRAAAA